MLQWAMRHRHGEIVGTAVVDGKTKLFEADPPGTDRRDSPSGSGRGGGGDGPGRKAGRAVIGTGMDPSAESIPRRVREGFSPPTFVLDKAGNVSERLEDGMPLWIEGDCFGSWNSRGEKVARTRPASDGRSAEREAGTGVIQHVARPGTIYRKHPARCRKGEAIRHRVLSLAAPVDGNPRPACDHRGPRGGGTRRICTRSAPISRVSRFSIALDGGADALLNRIPAPHYRRGHGFRDRPGAPCGAEVVVHAYPDGRAPELKWVKALNLNPHILPSVGTSEDVVMSRHGKGAELIVALGTHTNMVDFLEKGRKGMASTLVGTDENRNRAVDAKGVNQLYRSRMRWRELSLLGAASAFPVMALAAINPNARHLFRMLWLH